MDLADLLVELALGVPIGAGGADSGIELAVEAMEVVLPVETRLGDGAALLASYPRGRMATRVDPALARLSATFAVRRED